MKRRFLGLQYPVVKTPRGLFAQKQGIDQIKADLLQLLLTNPGERVMLPTFGTPLRELMFEPNDPALELQARQMIAKSITDWEPRIVIQNIAITSKFDERNLNIDDTLDEVEAILGISIKFVDPENISEVQELRVEVPIGSN